MSLIKRLKYDVEYNYLKALEEDIIEEGGLYEI